MLWKDKKLEWKELSDSWVEGKIPTEVYLSAVHNRIESLEYYIDEWLSVFGHLSEDPDEAGNMINEGLRGDTDELGRVRESYNILSNQYDDLLTKYNEVIRAKE